PVFERRMMAVLLLEAFEPLLRPVDIALLERLIRQSKTWAFVDELAIVIVGPLVERSPGLLRVLDRWAQDSDFRVRRSAVRARLTPLRVSDTRFADARAGSCTDEERGHPPTGRVAPGARCSQRCRASRFHPPLPGSGARGESAERPHGPSHRRSGAVARIL